MIVVHPLSGRRDATAFHLEAGRLCVLTSRHRQACIVVAREGITELLDSHPSTDAVHLSVPAKFPDGWRPTRSCWPSSPGTALPHNSVTASWPLLGARGARPGSKLGGERRTKRHRTALNGSERSALTCQSHISAGQRTC